MKKNQCVPDQFLICQLRSISIRWEFSYVGRTKWTLLPFFFSVTCSNYTTYSGWSTWHYWLFMDFTAQSHCVLNLKHQRKTQKNQHSNLLPEKESISAPRVNTEHTKQSTLTLEHLKVLKTSGIFITYFLCVTCHLQKT